VPLFTKQYKLVPCEGFHVDVPYVAAMAWSSMNIEKGSIVEAVLQWSWSLLGRFAKNRYINYLLYFLLFYIDNLVVIAVVTVFVVIIAAAMANIAAMLLVLTVHCRVSTWVGDHLYAGR